MAVLHITKENFENEVLNSDKPVLVDFWAAWCGPCQMLGPVIEEIEAEVKDTKICKLNVDEQPELALKFNVMTIPTLILFKDGKETNRTSGFMPKEEVLELINK